MITRALSCEGLCPICFLLGLRISTGFYLLVVLKSALLLRDKPGAWCEDKVVKETSHKFPCFSASCWTEE